MLTRLFFVFVSLWRQFLRCRFCLIEIGVRYRSSNHCNKYTEVLYCAITVCESATISLFFVVNSKQVNTYHHLSSLNCPVREKDSCSFSSDSITNNKMLQGQSALIQQRIALRMLTGPSQPPLGKTLHSPETNDQLPLLHYERRAFFFCVFCK